MKIEFNDLIRMKFYIITFLISVILIFLSFYEVKYINNEFSLIKSNNINLLLLIISIFMLGYSIFVFFSESKSIKNEKRFRAYSEYLNQKRLETSLNEEDYSNANGYKRNNEVYKSIEDTKKNIDQEKEIVNNFNMLTNTQKSIIQALYRHPTNSITVDDFFDTYVSKAKEEALDVANQTELLYRCIALEKDGFINLKKKQRKTTVINLIPDIASILENNGLLIS